MDGKKISPSSGAHRGAELHRLPDALSVGRASTSRFPGTRPSAIMTSTGAAALLFNDYVRSILVGNTVLDMGFDGTGVPYI